MSDYGEPPFNIKDQIMAVEADAYAKQGKLLTLSVYSNVGMGVAIVAFSAFAGYAMLKERDHLWAVAIDELGFQSVVKVSPKAATQGATLAAADRWIHDMMTIYLDDVANQRMRVGVVDKTFSTNEEKELFTKGALAQLENRKGFIAEVSPASFEDIGEAGTSWTAVWTVTYRDMRERADREPTVTKTYSATIQVKHVEPTIGGNGVPQNLDGILFIPVEPIEISTKGNSSNAR